MASTASILSEQYFTNVPHMNRLHNTKGMALSCHSSVPATVFSMPAPGAMAFEYDKNLDLLPVSAKAGTTQ